jgi:MFS family permease
MREYRNIQTIIANVPYGAMVSIGSGAIAFGFSFSPWALAGAIVYFLYGVAGCFWIMIFMCPFCTYYATRGCPCGYGILSARLVRKGKQDCFSEKFRRHIPVIVPLWVIPVVCVVFALLQFFSWQVLGLVLLFAVNSFVILPLVSKRHSCAECPQKDDCPWMITGGQTVIADRSAVPH